VKASQKKNGAKSHSGGRKSSAASFSEGGAYLVAWLVAVAGVCSVVGLKQPRERGWRPRRRSTMGGIPGARTTGGGGGSVCNWGRVKPVIRAGGGGGGNAEPVGDRAPGTCVTGGGGDGTHNLQRRAQRRRGSRGEGVEGASWQRLVKGEGVQSGTM
jgi:hypothetical protein